MVSEVNISSEAISRPELRANAWHSPTVNKFVDHEPLPEAEPLPKTALPKKALKLILLLSKVAI
jgi:hypothetical protein